MQFDLSSTARKDLTAADPAKPAPVMRAVGARKADGVFIKNGRRIKERPMLAFAVVAMADADALCRAMGIQAHRATAASSCKRWGVMFGHGGTVPLGRLQHQPASAQSFEDWIERKARMTQTARAEAFSKLHVPGTPLVLYNIWDAGSAQAVAKTGAKALATGSWSVAAAQGYADGEALPLDFLLRIAERIVATSDLPLSVDFEGAYALAPDGVQENVAALIATGAVGMNFEDRVVQGEGLHSLDVQAGRIAAARAAADAVGLPFFINARTDLFLGTDPATHAGLVPQALERAAAYTEAGASGFFVPGLSDPGLISQIVEGASLPVNVLKMGAVGALSELAALGVARVSYGPGPYRTAMKDLSEKAAHLE